MTLSEISTSEATLNDLMHDLRQSLGNIETSAYCLKLITDPAEARAHHYLCAIEQQVARAAELVTETASELRRHRP